MIICICHRVSDRDIAHAVQGGCASFDELQFELGVGTCCGRCHDCARETFHRHAAQADARQQRPNGCAPSMIGKSVHVLVPYAVHCAHDSTATAIA